jgi:hypothetical protein
VVPTAAPDPTPPPPDPDLATLDIDWATASVATDADATALWRRILPTAADWELRVAQIPDDKLAPLAGALLRGGGFACPPSVTGGCTPYVSYPEPARTATFDDACLRRELAIWAVRRLDVDQVEALAPALLAIASSRDVDDELAAAVVAAAHDQPESARMELIRAATKAGHEPAVADELGGLSEAALAEAATELHVDAAVETLDVEHSRKVYLAAVADPELAPRTRLAAIAELVIVQDDRPLPKDLDKALTAATRDRSCVLAAAAANALVQLGKPHARPSRPRNKKTAEATRALCVMAAGDMVAVAAGFVGPRGLKIVERTFDADLEFAPDENADGDNDPRTDRRVETVTRKMFEDIPFDTELPLALESCQATTCPVPGTGIELTLSFIPAKDGGLWLDTIERFDRGECGGNPPQ